MLLFPYTLIISTQIFKISIYFYQVIILLRMVKPFIIADDLSYFNTQIICQKSFLQVLKFIIAYHISFILIKSNKISNYRHSNLSIRKNSDFYTKNLIHYNLFWYKYLSFKLWHILYVKRSSMRGRGRPMVYFDFFMTKFFIFIGLQSYYKNQIET